MIKLTSIVQDKASIWYPTFDISFTLDGMTNPDTTDEVYYEVKTMQASGAYFLEIDRSFVPVKATTGALKINSIMPNETEIYFSEGTYKIVI